MKKIFGLGLLALFGFQMAGCVNNNGDDQNNSGIQEGTKEDETGGGTTGGNNTGNATLNGSSVVNKEKGSCYGANEVAYAIFNDTNASNARAFYKLAAESNYKAVDNELIRTNSSTTGRVDIVGLRKGVYDIKVIPGDNSGEIIFNNLNVYENDRSGYAHFKYDKGVGAYKNDGTLKDNAVVVYVNNQNKNTVEAIIDGQKMVGLSNIVKAQTNLSKALVVRILGEVNAPTWNPLSVSKYSKATTTTVKGANGKYLELKGYTEDDLIKGGYNTLNETSTITKLNGLTSKIKYDSTKGEFDSYWNELEVNYGQNITIEGIGSDAKIFQWGFTWKNCSSIEVRNITFDDYTEDACSFEGSDDSTTAAGFKTGHIWIHNNTFNEGKNYWDVCSEQDKHEGDGTTDFKKNANITISYNRYFKNHKTGLVGGKDTHRTANLTFHHNFYDQNQSRLPYARQANMHMYNNYYYKSSGNNMQLYAGANAFIEGCYFESIKNKPVFSFKTSDGKVPCAKLFECIFNDCSSNTGTVVKSRTASVDNDCLYGKNFDTDSNAFYYDSVKKASDVLYLTDANKAKEDCMKFAGALKEGMYGVAYDTKSNNQDDNIGGGTTGGNQGGDSTDDNTGSDIINPGDSSKGQILSNIYGLDLSKLTGVTTDNTKDIYYASILGSDMTSSDGNASNVVISNNSIKIVDKSATNTTEMYVKIPSQTSGKISLSTSLSVEGAGSKWGIFQIWGNDGTEIVRIGTGTSGSKIGYQFVGLGETSPTDSSLTFAANKNYTFIVDVDIDNNKISAYVINDNNKSIIFENKSYDVSKISSLKFMTAKAATNRDITISAINVGKYE